MALKQQPATAVPGRRCQGSEPTMALGTAALGTAALSTAIQIRAMRKEDLEQVQAIDRISFSLPWPANAYRYELEENPNSRCWVAEINNPSEASEASQAVVGVIVVWLIIDEAHIATLAVHPDYRRRGISRQLLVFALKDAVQRGATQATLEVRAGNWIAQKLYLRFRFEIVGRRVRYYRDNNEDGLIMTVSRLGEEYLTWLETQS